MNNIGATAALHSVMSKNTNCVQIMSSIPGVDWNIKTDTGVSPLKLAVRYGSTDILRILLQIPNIDLNITDGWNQMANGLTITQIAVRSNEANSLQCLELL